MNDWTNRWSYVTTGESGPQSKDYGQSKSICLRSTGKKRQKMCIGKDFAKIYAESSCGRRVLDRISFWLSLPGKCPSWVNPSQGFSKYNPQSRSISITWELRKCSCSVSIPDLLNQLRWGWAQPSVFYLTSPQGDSDAHWRLSSTILHSP